MQHLWTLQILRTMKTEEDATTYKQDQNPSDPSQSDTFITEHACWFPLVNNILLRIIVNKHLFFFFFLGSEINSLSADSKRQNVLVLFFLLTKL